MASVISRRSHFDEGASFSFGVLRLNLNQHPGRFPDFEQSDDLRPMLLAAGVQFECLRHGVTDPILCLGVISPAAGAESVARLRRPALVRNRNVRRAAGIIHYVNGQR